MCRLRRCSDQIAKSLHPTHPSFQILTKDSVTVHVDAIMYYKVYNAISAISNVDDYGQSTRLLAATTLRQAIECEKLGVEAQCARFGSDRCPSLQLPQISVTRDRATYGCWIETVSNYARSYRDKSMMRLVFSGQ